MPKSLREGDVETYIWGPHDCGPGCTARFHDGPGLRESMGDGALNRSLSALEVYLTWAFRMTYVRGEVINPTTRRVRYRPSRRLQLDIKQLVDLYEGAEDPYSRMVCALAAYTGGRAGEIKTIRVGDVDLGRGEIDWTRHKTRTDDVLPIMAELHSELERWFAHYAAANGPLRPDWYVIPGRHGLGQPGAVVYRPTRPRVHGCHTIIKDQLVRVLGVAPEDLRGEGVHTVRRSIARCLYEQLLDERHADPISVVRALLGHSTRGMTERHIGVETGRTERDRVLRGRSMLKG
ncbi:tyrosine-type recombinase/integrase [Pseudonocardia sp. N23]|uniref:tyrosine-type recombinase/integrase n=1 Tax=Pseudonocardia sp. N23 TaxID=1987376 RepID=UPI000C02F7B2|nr:tyrosine-type recombinase/integrase [Pseudonocardia sp. N23]GAY07496.1 hypothetical protein TOK_3516 [Pseudonocardia sp. N23]